MFLALFFEVGKLSEVTESGETAYALAFLLFLLRHSGTLQSSRLTASFLFGHNLESVGGLVLVWLLVAAVTVRQLDANGQNYFSVFASAGRPRPATTLTKTNGKTI